MSVPPNSLYINKIAAASRQLNLAIRLFFAKEDELGIHTLAWAAFTILRNLFKHRRGHLFMAEVLRNGIYSMAHQYADGSMSKDMLNRVENSALKQVFEKIIREETSEPGENFDLTRINLPMKNEERAWPSRSAGFLKHAVKDPSDYLAIDPLRNENENVLIGSCAAYLEIIAIPSPEIIAFCAFWAAKNDADVGEGARRLLLKLKSVEVPARYHLCADFISEAKRQ
jgi:hypothetical protein